MKEWLQKFDWRENPFNFKIYPDLMVGYKDKLSKIDESIYANNKFSVVLGQTGAGKTNLLRWLVSQYRENRNVYYMPKPPKSEEDFLTYLRDEVLDPGFLSKMFGSYSLYNIHHELDEAMDEPSLLVIDEGHEASLEVLEWVRTVLDHVDNLTIITAGLPIFKQTLISDLHTLYNRATNVVHLDSLNKDETISLVKKRIEKTGGKSLEPFTQNAILNIYETTNGFPREILRACNSCVIHAARENFSIIDSEDVDDILDESSFSREGTSDYESPDDSSSSITEDLTLTPKQQKVVDVLEELGDSSSGEIADSIDTDGYTSRSHAVRSINNILKRLMDNGIVDRRKEGRSYTYFLED